MLNLHLKGASIRTLAARTGKCLGATYNHIRNEIKELPHNNDVTAWYCNPKRWGGSILVDGKFVKVKGYDRKIPFIYGIDYITHDIPICMLAPSENYQALVQFFTKLKNTGYPLVTVTCDDNDAIRQAAMYVYPGCLTQLCHVHFLENIRKLLNVRTDETYQKFFADLEKHLFDLPALGEESMKRRIRWRSPRHMDDPLKIKVMQDIFNRSELLTAYIKAEAWFRVQCPKTTNLIESYNKQLQGRLKTIQGFESPLTAERWLSAWILRRRFTPFTDCRGKFKKLNGTPSIQNSKKGKVKLPNFFGI